jgi:hypothetical protein
VLALGIFDDATYWVVSDLRPADREYSRFGARHKRTQMPQCGPINQPIPHNRDRFSIVSRPRIQPIYPRRLHALIRRMLWEPDPQHLPTFGPERPA